jgi:hypothetical protein
MEKPRFGAALQYTAPFLIEKLVKDQIVRDAGEAELLFMEVKRYLVLSRLDRDISWDMYSRRVDEVWHQFALFTHEYAEFCTRFFGSFVHHRPSNAPTSTAELTSGPASSPSTFADFRARYLEVFQQELPESWIDALNVSENSRLICEKPGQFTVSEAGGRVSLVDDTGVVQFSVDSLAASALEFIATTGAFYVRELPGDLTDEERTAMAALLVETHLLRIAP